MKIILGYWLDSNAYPDALREEKATIGTIVTGFKGLVGILETQLGLTSPQVSENIRIALWQDLIHHHDTGGLLFSKSFKTDSWNTAKELLRRRDELIISGWDPTVHVGGGKWIETLAQLELANKHRILGFSDRVRVIVGKLRDKNQQLSIRKITIVDKDTTLWDPWSRELVSLLKENRIEVVNESFHEGELLEPSSDLTLLQAVFAGKQPRKEAIGDQSLLLIESEQELDAADFLASWLQENGTENTVLIKGEGSLLLDEVLYRRGVPAIGVDATSKWRAVLQVLPLTIDTYWKPLRVERMLELLTIPTSPIPVLIRYRLARALSDNPGIGGEQWTRAIEEGIKNYEERWQKENIDERELKKRRKNLETKLELWVNHEYYDPDNGIPLEKLAEICQKVGQWARGHYQVTDDVMYMHAGQVAMEVFEGIQTLGVGNVSHLQIARILDSVIGSGTTLSTYYAEAAKWDVVNHPGQIWKNTDTIIWWGFNKQSSDASPRTWLSKEKAWLKEREIQLIEEDVRRQRETDSWQHAVRFANKRLLLIAPSKIKGEKIPVHPLWDEIRFAIASEHETKRKITFDASALRKQSGHALFGDAPLRSAQQAKTIPQPITRWIIPENIIKPRKEESATSLESLIGCPLQWTFKYVANIKQGNILSLPNDSIMLGNLGHAILEHLINEKLNWEKSEIRKRVGELFDELTPQMAATLMEPKNGIEWESVRTNLQVSIWQFFNVLNETGIQIDGTEKELQKSWNDDIHFRGRLDLIGKTRTGKKMFIDAKWSRRPSNYKKRLENLSVQLALYHWLLIEQENDEFPVAYFMLRSGEFYSLPHGDFPSSYHVDGPSLTDSYQVVRKAAEGIWSQLATGNVVASGVLEGQNEDHSRLEYMKTIDPPCTFCEYENLCGIRRMTQ